MENRIVTMAMYDIAGRSDVEPEIDRLRSNVETMQMTCAEDKPSAELTDCKRG